MMDVYAIIANKAFVFRYDARISEEMDSLEEFSYNMIDLSEERDSNC